MTVVNEGSRLLHSSKLWKNSVSCDQCHPNAANTPPETYPKFQKQIGEVITLFEVVNWCIQNPLEGTPLAADDPKMVALEAYITYERRGVPLAPGIH
jgi:cytochrome c